METTQLTFGEHCMIRYSRLEHLRCGVPEEYEGSIVREQNAVWELAADWEEPTALGHRQMMADPASRQREMWEISFGF